MDRLEVYPSNHSIVILENLILQRLEVYASNRSNVIFTNETMDWSEVYTSSHPWLSQTVGQCPYPVTQSTTYTFGLLN